MMLAGHINASTMWRVQTGGFQTVIESGGAIAGKAVADQNDADDRDQRKQAAIRPFADPGDQRGAPVAHGHEHMRAEKNNKAENFDRKAHEYPGDTARRSVGDVSAAYQASRPRRLPKRRPLGGIALVALEIACGIDQRLALLERDHVAAHRGRAAVAGDRGEHTLHGFDRGALGIARDDDERDSRAPRALAPATAASCRPRTC